MQSGLRKARETLDQARGNSELVQTALVALKGRIANQRQALEQQEAQVVKCKDEIDTLVERIGVKVEVTKEGGARSRVAVVSS